MPAKINNIVEYKDIQTLRETLRRDSRDKILRKIRSIGSDSPEAITYATAGLLETHFSPQELATILGTSRTTIMRWAEGKNIPRSPGFRKWAVERMAVLLGDTGQMEQDVAWDVQT
jgi:hypothetical protein